MRKVLLHLQVRRWHLKLGDEEGFRWVGAYEISADDLLDGKEGKPTENKNCKRGETKTDL